MPRQSEQNGSIFLNIKCSLIKTITNSENRSIKQLSNTMNKDTLPNDTVSEMFKHRYTFLTALHLY